VPQRNRVSGPPVGHGSFERRRAGRCPVLVFEPKLNAIRFSFPSNRLGPNGTPNVSRSRGGDESNA
jgi:hypothetical protein